MSHDVIMPQLGMSQDTAVIVSWCKSVGDPVVKGDILFEVETDKAVMEVEARHDGFVTAILAEVQQDIPVGDVIALIGSDASETPAQSQAAPVETAAPAEVVAAVVSETISPPQLTTNARPSQVLASPKAKRLAEQRGIDLQQLLQQGAVEPLHAADIPLTASVAQSASGATCAVLQATCSLENLNDLSHWAEQELATPIAKQQLWASFCAAANPTAAAGDTQYVALSDLSNNSAMWSVTGRGLQQASLHDGQTTAAMQIYDFSGSCISGYQAGDVGTVPTLVISCDDQNATLSLSYQPSALSLQQAAQWLQAIARRCQNPLFHLF